MQLEEVLGRAKPRLAAVLERFRIPPEEAKDLLQQSYLAYLRKQGGLDDPVTWLVGALQKECLFYLRRQRRRLYEAVDEALLELCAGGVGAPQERNALLAEVQRVVQRLRVQCQRILHLRFGLGYERGEVAEAMSYVPESIGVIERRCLEQLTRELLQAVPEEGNAHA